MLLEIPFFPENRICTLSGRNIGTEKWKPHIVCSHSQSDVNVYLEVNLLYLYCTRRQDWKINPTI